MDILNIFYNHVVKEATTGSINCGFLYNIHFETHFSETEKKIETNEEYEDVLMPTLIIDNKKIFDELLIKYVRLCLDFYTDIDFYPEFVNKEDLEKYKISKEKIILTILWMNATDEDFRNPVNFLKRRIAFLENSVFETKEDCGYCDILKGVVTLSIEKDKVYNETPYKMVITLTNEDGENYEFPQVKFGIDEDTVYIYAIQNFSEIQNTYSKKLNRLFYKIGEGFDTKLDNYDIYEDGNLKDVTSSFLIALNMAVSYFNSLGYTKLVIPSILINRWNSKKIAIDMVDRQGILSDTTKGSLLDDQEYLQRNMTEKFLRTFLRLVHHYENIEINSYPTELDLNLHLNINGELTSNNLLLNETANIVKINNKNKNI